MVTYNPKDWIILILHFHKSDTFKKLFISLICIGVYAAAIVYTETSVVHFHIKNSTALHSILGFALSMLLVFRTNSAYDRWWEGRKIWGSVVNNSRNLALKLTAFSVSKKNRIELKYLIINYFFSLKNHLRDVYVESEFFATDDLTLADFSKANHKPNKIAQVIYNKIIAMRNNNELTMDQLLIINEELKSFTDNCGASERIKNTPIPFSYNIFLKKLIFLYCISLPLFFGGEFGYTTVPITMILLYVFASIELIAEEIEDPFGTDENDLPADNICEKLKNNLNEILD
jgi:ion channel-forming bestrophin family protein